MQVLAHTHNETYFLLIPDAVAIGFFDASSM
jgi:hypothetical protein